MGQDRLNGLAMMQYHRSIVFDPEEVVKEYANRQPRRLLLVNPLHD